MKILGYPKQIKELDGIRGLACILVVLHHYFINGLNLTFSGQNKIIFDFISMFFLSGVDLFFVLSGFLVGGIIIDHYSSPNFVKAFYWRRILRIFPVYYILIISFYLGHILLDEFYFFDDWLFKHPYPIWPYLVFVQSYFFGFFGNSGPLWVAVTWSVSVEEQFYLLTPFLLSFFGKRKALNFILFGIIIAPFIRLYLSSNGGFYAAYMFFPARMDSLFWGVLLAYLLRNESWRRKLKEFSFLIYGITFVLLLSFFFGVGTSPVYIFTSLPIFYTCIIWIILEGKSKKVKSFISLQIFTYVGSISYAVYMFHQMINGLLFGSVLKTKPIITDVNSFLLTFLSIATTVVISHLSLRYFENPIREIGRKHKYYEIREMKT